LKFLLFKNGPKMKKKRKKLTEESEASNHDLKIDVLILKFGRF